MTDRQRFCIIVLSIMIIGSGLYLGYYIFVSPDKQLIEKFNYIRLCLFFSQHFMTLVMLSRFLNYEDNYEIIYLMFQQSSIIVFTFIAAEVFISAKGGRFFGTSLFLFHDSKSLENQNIILQFEVNQITLYFQIMTDFIMFFIVSAIAMIVIKCRTVEEQQRYEFIIDNLKSQDWVDDPYSVEKKCCSICLTDLVSQRVLRVPCQHYFHKECLCNWLKRSSICPLCRTNILQSLDQSRHQHLLTQQIHSNSQNSRIPQENLLIQPVINNFQSQISRIDANNRNIETQYNTNIRFSIAQNIRDRNIRERENILRETVHDIKIQNIEINPRPAIQKVSRPIKLVLGSKPIATGSIETVLGTQQNLNKNPQNTLGPVLSKNVNSPKRISNKGSISYSFMEPLSQEVNLKSELLLEKEEKKQFARLHQLKISRISQQQINKGRVKQYRNPNERSFFSQRISVQRKNKNQIPGLNNRNQIIRDKVVI